MGTPRRPADHGVAVSTVLAGRQELATRDRVDLSAVGDSRELTVTAVFDSSELRVLVLQPSLPAGLLPSFESQPFLSSWYVYDSLPVTWDAVTELNQSGMAVLS